MPLYLFDVLVQGLIEADNDTEAENLICTLGSDHEWIDVSDHTDIKLQLIPPCWPEE